MKESLVILKSVRVPIKGHNFCSGLASLVSLVFTGGVDIVFASSSSNFQYCQTEEHDSVSSASELQSMLHRYGGTNFPDKTSVSLSSCV